MLFGTDLAGERACSVVVPAYRSADTLGPLVERLLPVLRAHFGSFEVLLVDDGSPDGTWGVIEALAAKYPFVRGFRLMRNFGQHNALLCGVREARHPVVITMDDDLQHPPEEIPKLLEALDRGYDVVYGAPEREVHGLRRDLASKITKMTLKGAMGASTARHISAFRVFRAKLREAFANFAGPHVSLDVLLTWGTTRFAHVVVRHDPRKSGASNYTVGKLVVHALNMMTGFSTLPLRLATVVGFLFALFGMGILAYVLVRYFTAGVAVQGFAFLSSIIAIFSGAQLFSLGILGEYLGRVHQRTMDRPSYAVQTRTGEAGT